MFTRIKNSAKTSRDRKQSVIGDNCPLLYALKRKQGLNTDITSIKRLLESGNAILSTLAQQLQADTVVYMPSSHSLSKIVARRCALKFQAALAHEVFVKTTRSEACQMIELALAQGAITTQDRKRLHFRLKAADVFSLKAIPIGFRQFFSPVRLNELCGDMAMGRVVMVDDLLATGRTLSVARQLVLTLPGVTSVEAVCLFSDV
ncbi:phosphoribosyltransferase [Pseudomonas sp. KNUC1026]|uniref:phosphoribosyltransferase n=1 Tax=Pseudomonas sp. KNUC1026 TaxID=2893890 RepID=UPI001F3FEC84|nr:phosphoribosyltransferase [Pseudomonas sp. KNUC1026]UFH49065.1 phosphoribosyltransferase [Pseudomonas sp. KNUC1026]